MEENQELDENGIINPWDTVVILPNDVQEFMADGRFFFVNRDVERMTIDFYENYEQLSMEISFVLTPDELFNALNVVQQLLVNNERVKAIIDIENIKKSVAATSMKRITIAMYLCTLFILEEGEDIKKPWTLERAKSKIAAWKKEGIGMSFFTAFAFSLVTGFKERFLSISEEYSEMSQMSQRMLQMLDSMDI